MLHPFNVHIQNDIAMYVPKNQKQLCGQLVSNFTCEQKEFVNANFSTNCCEQK